MLATASGFALLAALTPTALLVCAVYLGSATPRRAMFFYLLGAITMTLVIGIIVLVALRAGGLSLPSRSTPRYGLRLGLGVLALAGGVYLARRRRQAAGRPASEQRQKKPGLVSRMMTRPGPLSAYITGILVFVPSAAFVAAIQTIATAHASLASSAATLAAVVAIDVMLVWLPFLLYLARPDATTVRLRAFDGWLRQHGRSIVIVGLITVGLLLVLDGALGLA
ncbi:MAG TPA: GAP family protein [Streptosporangiaceae bacterium]|jgi:hypothetical protein